MRRILFQIHRWLGLVLAVWVVVVSVTGAVLIFRPELQKATFPEFFSVDRRPSPDADAASLLAALREAYPAGRIAGLDWPTYRRDTVLAYVTDGTRLRTVFLHPQTGAVIGEMPEHSWLSRLQDLHFNLLGGSTGRLINGIAALCLTALLITALPVWWPAAGRWRQALTIDFDRSWQRTVWQAHGAVGFWLLSLLLLWAVTGVEFAFPRQFRAAVNAVSPLTRLPAPESDVSRRGSAPAPSAAGLVAHARMLVPGAILGRLVLPASDRGATLVLMAKQVHGDYDTSDEVLLYFDQHTGRLVETRDHRDLRRTAGDVFMVTVGPLHIGALGGAPVKVLWFVLALAFPLLAASGAVMWWNRS